MSTRCDTALSALLASLCLALPAIGVAQPPPGPPPQAPRTAREAAPVDLTGYWVSVVSEDWRWRMLTPVRGDFQSIPLNAEGRRVGMEWDPARDEAAGSQCKAYGAPALLRIPGRVRITWQDDAVLKIETDAGMQTRLLRFDAPPSAPEPPSRQGQSVASWERPPRSELPADTFLRIFSGTVGNNGRSLEVTTTNLLPGYLRKNGPPYSERTTMEEFFDYHVQPNGDEWFTVTTVVRDPVYLNGPFITSSDFKKEPNGDHWDSGPCSAR
jgi:hypothetical protein